MLKSNSAHVQSTLHVHVRLRSSVTVLAKFHFRLGISNFSQFLAQGLACTSK